MGSHAYGGGKSHSLPSISWRWREPMWGLLSESAGLRRRMSQLNSWGLQWIGWCPPTVGKAMCIIQSTDSSANTLTDTPPRNNVLTKYLGNQYTMTQSTWWRNLTITHAILIPFLGVHMLVLSTSSNAFPIITWLVPSWMTTLGVTFPQRIVP